MLDSIQSTLSERFIEFLGLALTLLSGWAINQLRLWLKTKAKIELTDAQEKRLRTLAAEAVDAAEEWAYQQKKSGNPVASGEKLAIARKHVESSFSSPVLNGEADKAIHAVLGKRRSIAPGE
jgi:hypothetical protein